MVRSVDAGNRSQMKGENSESSLSILGTPVAYNAGREAMGSRGDQTVNGRNVPGQDSSGSSDAAGISSKLA